MSDEFISKKIADSMIDDLDYFCVEYDIYDTMRKYDLLKDEWIILKSGNRHEIYYYKIYFRNTERIIEKHNNGSKLACRIFMLFTTIILLVIVFQGG